jgi:hypothetical protein
MSSKGDVVVGTFREDGVATAELITRLPQRGIRDRDASLLIVDDADGTRDRQVMVTPNDRPFKRHHAYVSDNCGEKDLDSPFLLTRQRNTIPTRMFSVRGALEDGLDLAGEARKRICYSHIGRSGD